MNIQEQILHNKRPINNTVKKILVGKLFSFHFPYSKELVILAVRRNSLYGYLEMLVGENYKYSNQINVMSWYAYRRKSMHFCGRDTKVRIKKCIILNPKEVAWHLGRQIDLSKVQIVENYKRQDCGYYGIIDRSNYYKEYLLSLSKV